MTKHERAIEAAAEAFAANNLHADYLVPIAHAIAAYNAVMAEPEPGTVPVRVCVAIDQNSNWIAAGGLGMPDDLARSECRECHQWNNDLEYRWVEAVVRDYEAIEPVAQGVEK